MILYGYDIENQQKEEDILADILFRLKANSMKIEFAYDFLELYNLNVDWNVGHSLSAGVPGASSGVFAPAESPLDTLFPRVSLTFRSNQLCFKM